jgi:tetratricopeptide (TPR) repeat protein
MVLERAGRDREAVEHLSAAFRGDPTDGEISRVLIRLLLKLSRGDEAIDVLSRAPSFDVEDEGLVLGLSILLADRQRYRDAIDLLESSHRQFPDRARIDTTLARLLAAAPDRSLRDGARALELSMRVYDRDPSAAHGETVALALAESGRCGDAAMWIQRAVAQAEQTRDSATATRLRAEAPRYQTSQCRP